MNMQGAENRPSASGSGQAGDGQKRRKSGGLNPASVKAATSPGRYGDGGGLHLFVRDAERRSWVFRYTAPDGRRRDMGLGEYPDVGLAEARDRAADCRRMLRDGLDPLEARRAKKDEARAARARTFKAAAELLIADKAAGWRNAKHRAQWSATLEAHAFPELGERPVSAIGTDDVLRVLRPIWTRTPETASRLRGRIENVLDFARTKGWRSGENPARWKGHLSHQLAAPRKVKAVRHQPALAWARMPDFWAALADRDGMGALALRFTILTAARSGEVRGMTWREIDMDARVWTVPGSRMKASKAHRVPLSAAAVAILDAVRPITGGGPDALVFSVRRGKPLSDLTLGASVRRMNEDHAKASPADPVPFWRDGEGNAITVHGFRSTFRDWAGETQAAPREVVEAALAHTLKDKAEAAYARSDLLERRRALMDTWAAWCERGTERGEVIEIQPRRAIAAGA